MTENQIIKIIADKIESSGISKTKIAEKVGVDRHTIYKFTNSKCNTSFLVVMDLCDFLGLEIIVRERGAE